MTFYEYIVSKIGKTSVTSMDGEIIDEADDYRGLIEDLFELTEGELKLESFSAKDNGDRASVEVTVNGTDHNLDLEVSGWINDDFIPAINRILGEKKLEGRFYQFWTGDSFEQEVGFFFASRDAADEIFNYSKIKNENATDYGELYMVTDGEREEGYDVDL